MGSRCQTRAESSSARALKLLKLLDEENWETKESRRDSANMSRSKVRMAGPKRRDFCSEFDERIFEGRGPCRNGNKAGSQKSTLI